MRKDDVFPGAQENIGVGRTESAAHCGALGLEEALTPEDEEVAGEDESQHGQERKVGSIWIRKTLEGSGDRRKSVLGRDVGVEGGNVEGAQKGRVID